MRITVLSDSHRRRDAVRKVLEQQPESRHVFFLGDVVADVEDLRADFPEKEFHVVCGNCDVFSLLPSSGIEQLAGKKIFYTHGHTFGVKYGVEKLAAHARATGCEIALFGHTHTSQIVYEEGLYLVNPGSCAEPRNGAPSYAVIDITEKGIMPIIIPL